MLIKWKKKIIIIIILGTIIYILKLSKSFIYGRRPVCTWNLNVSRYNIIIIRYHGGLLI